VFRLPSKADVPGVAETQFRGMTANAVTPQSRNAGVSAFPPKVPHRRRSVDTT
jgi:hypothetical protein